MQHTNAITRVTYSNQMAVMKIDSFLTIATEGKLTF